MATKKRSRGRPKLAENKKKSIVIRARVTFEEHEHIKKVAQQKGLTVTQLILLGVLRIEEDKMPSNCGG